MFYRDLNHAEWQIGPDPKAEGVFHVLLAEEFRADLKLLYRDPVSNTVIMQ